MEKTIRLRKPYENELSALMQDVAGWRDGGCRVVRIDLVNVDFLNSISIGLLVRLAIAGRNHDVRVVVERPSPPVRATLDHAAVAELLGLPSQEPPEFETMI